MPPTRVNGPEASHRRGYLQMQYDSTFPLPPLQVRAGIAVVDGYGISLRILHGKLHIEDGIGDRRRSLVLDRAGSGLERLVLLGKTGSLTLESLAWLRAIGAALVQIAPDGALLTQSVPFGYDGHPIRRSQALAIATGLDVDLARDLIARKAEGQRANLVRLGVTDLRPFDCLREALNGVCTIDEVRLLEAKTAAIYWNAWAKVAVRFTPRDLARVPAHWVRGTSRASILTGAPRAASNPVNALLNYVYSLVEAESRLALLAAGLDPTLGVLHTDQRNRDSFALDTMEAIRADVDAFVLDLLQSRVFTRRDFAELPNGVCRVRAPLTHDLALTIPRWRILVAPFVAHLARMFRTAALDHNCAISLRRRVKRKAQPASIGLTSANPLASVQSPLHAIPRKAPAVRPYASKAWNVPRPAPLALIPSACASCAAPVIKRRRRYCEACLPKQKRAHGEQIISTARKALAAQVREAPDPRSSERANAQRGNANAEHHRLNREWKRENGAHDRDWFLREITPKLDTLSLRAIAEATGLSLAACSRFRSGTRVPHPRHWPAFATLLEEVAGQACKPR